jgi:hypothetical protein
VHTPMNLKVILQITSYVMMSMQQQSSLAWTNFSISNTQLTASTLYSSSKIK